jgi:hypothetical protein
MDLPVEAFIDLLRAKALSSGHELSLKNLTRLAIAELSLR